MHTEPGPENEFLADHVDLLRGSFTRLTGRDMVDPGCDRLEAARIVWHAPFVVLSHNTDADPILTYANLAGQELFALDWDTMVRTPSRLTAETPQRLEREKLLDEVNTRGFIDNYAGVRVSSDGRHFRIERATVWNMVDQDGIVKGQAATFDRWQYID